MHYLYKLTCIVNGKIYIGQAKNPAARWRSHKSDAKIRPCQVIDRAIRKHGHNNFVMDVIAGCRDLTDTNHTEIELITQYNSRDLSIGYNISTGGGNIGDGKPNSGSFQSGSSHKKAKLTEEQVTEIMRLAKQELTQKQIAQQYGVTRTTISLILRGKHWSHITGIQSKPSPGLPHTKLTPKQILEIVDLSKQNLTQQDIARRYCVTTTAIGLILCGKNWSHLTGIKFQSASKCQFTPEQVLEILKLSKDGLTQCEIAERFGAGQSTISRILLGQSWSHLTGIKKSK